MFEYHSFSLILTVAVSSILLFSASLHRFYAPLAHLVDVSLITQFFGAMLYFMYHPYIVEGEGNCPEVFLSRINTVAIMFGELHQVYFIANILGLGYHRFVFKGFISCTLPQVLKFALVVMVVSIITTFLFFNAAIDDVEFIWTIFISLVQIYVIHLAKSISPDHCVGAAIPASDIYVRIFEKLSTLQLVPSAASLIISICWDEYNLEYFKDLKSVELSIDIFCVFIFYLKALLIAERVKSAKIIEEDDV